MGADRLRGRVAVVTGASSGIGAAAAREMARRGMHVVLAGRAREALEREAEAVVSLGGRALAVPTDVCDRAPVQRLLDASLEHFGRIDVWVNNAGSGLVASFEQTTAQEMEAIWRVNYMGAFHGCAAALQQMRRQGRGHIVNVSSLAGRFALPLNAAYCASKAAMTALSHSLRAELEGSGIHVTVVLPGWTETPFSQNATRKIPDVCTERRAVRPDPPERVARAIVAVLRRPRPEVVCLPAPRLVLAVTDLAPSAWHAVARAYLRVRTGGRGLPPRG
ncbi:MAG TPA: SDR family oxidoreductase [Chthonomonadales bacterium]|nr:SDR family oxidoreductase [Chthonomonadales bacterium]